MLRSRWFRVVLASIPVAAVAGGAWSARTLGTDFIDMMLGGARFLAGAPLYEGSGPAYGMVGPPFQGLVLAPFAWVAAFQPQTARLLWALVNLGAGWLALRAWSRALGVTPGAPAALAAAAAIAFPLYREVQTQNITLILFACMGFAAAALVRGDDRGAGVWIGLATAIKLFPGLAILYLAARSRWRAAAMAAMTAAVLTLLPAVRYGAGGFVGLWRAWLYTRTHGDFPVWTQNQSLATALGAWMPMVAATCVLVGIAGALLAVGWRRRANGADGLAIELTLALAVSVVLSPIAWVAYWVLLFPAFLVLANRALRNERVPAVIFVTGAALVSGVSVWRRAAPGHEDLLAAGLLIAALAMGLLSRRATRPV